MKGKKRRVHEAAGKASLLVRSGKAKVNWQKLSRTTLNRIIQDAQGNSTQADRKAAQKASAELARRGG